MRGVEEFAFLWGKCIHVLSDSAYNSAPDVLSEPDDSYQTREPKKTRKQKNTDTSESIAQFLNKPPAPVADPEDVMMNEGEAATMNEEPSV